MIATSTTQRIPYTPFWRAGEPTAPRYFFRAGSVVERGLMEAELSGIHRAAKIWQHEVQAAIRGGIATLLADDPELDRVLALFDEEDEAALSDEDRRSRQEVLGILAEHWPPYRELNAQVQRRAEIAPIEVMRRFLVGFENLDIPFTRGVDGMVSEATLAAIDPLELKAAGNFGYGLLYPSEQTRNFQQPSASANGRKTSSTGKRRAAGSSARKPGRKTRA